MNSLLARCFYQATGPARSLCGGHGRCGRCRVRFLQDAPPATELEEKILSTPELAEGWRLACKHPEHPILPAQLEIPTTTDVGHASWHPGGRGPSRLAVDLGTTSIAWRIVSAGATLAHGQGLNPQGVMGAEVMARLSCAAHAACARRLGQVVVDHLQGILTAAKARAFEVKGLCVAGNSVMTSMLLGKDLSGLAAAPYRLDYQGGQEEALPKLPPVYVPPLAGPFIGADVMAGLAWLIHRLKTPFPLLLLDLGTNGECVLALDESTFLATSVAMGPALEGVGLTCGRLAGPGVVTQVQLTPAGLRWLDWQGRPLQHPEALSGSGALGLVQTLLVLGILQEDGRFTQGSKHPLATRVGEDVCRIGEEQVFCLDEVGSVRLTAPDIEQLLKVKAACNVATSVLLEEARLAWNDLAAVRLAGALGEHLSLAVLEGTGWLPPQAIRKPGLVQAVGNSALEGAAFLCENTDAQRWTADAARHMQVLNLAELPTFQSMFLHRMTFRHVV